MDWLWEWLAPQEQHCAERREEQAGLRNTFPRLDGSVG